MTGLSKVLSALVLVLMVCSPAMAQKKNVILFVTDDQGQDAGCYGNPVLKTPNLDRLASEGTLYTQAFCTTASCAASRSVILSGLHNHANGMYGHEHSYSKMSSFEWVKGLPVLLEEGGYRTARVGKYHVAPEESYKFQKVFRANPRNAVEMVESARAFIADGSDEPFFLYMATTDPHRGGGQAMELPYSPDRFGNPPPGQSYPGVTEVIYDPREVIVPPYLPDTPEARAEIAQYYQSISRIDQGIGRLLEVLEETGRIKDTLIIYIADHGIAMPGGKTTVYEGGLRSPLIVRHPTVERRGVVCDAMISWVDLTPTILDYAGVLGKSVTTVDGPAMPGSGKQREYRPGSSPQPLTVLHGRSFLSTVEQDHPKGWDLVYASHTFHEIQMYYPMRVIRDRKWKLIWNIAHQLPYPFASDLWAAPTWQSVWKQGMDAMYGMKTVRDYIYRPQFELYDVERDPWEAKNLAGEAAYASLLEEMKAKLKAFQLATNDPWSLKWEYD